jgi:NAD(P)H-dependent FMN reductase
VSRQRIIGFCGSSWRPAKTRALVVEHQLRPLFGFFEACTVSTAIYASATEFDAAQPLPPIIAARLANAVDQFAGHLKARCADAARPADAARALRFSRSTGGFVHA